MSDTETDSDNEFLQDIQALKRACSLKTKTTDDDDVIPKSSSSTVTLDDDDEDDDDIFDDMELLKNIKKRFSIPKSKKDEEEEVVMKPLNTILPEDGDNIDDEDYGGDFETLRAIQRRFSQYNDCTSNGMESPVQRSETQVGATNIKESSPNFFVTRNNNRQGFPDSVDGRAADNHISTNPTSATNVSEGHEPCSELVPAGDSGFPASAQAFVEAIKKNRTYQKFLRDKLLKVEARLEENKKLRERVKFLKGFQVDCRKRTGRALSQRKDPRFKLISAPKLRANAYKRKDRSTHPINQGPAQNPQVAIYREERMKYSVSLNREPWSKADNENLKKGIKQQIQEMMMQNLFSAEDPNSSNLDRMITRIKKREITPAEIRSFLPKVNWEQLASMYLTGRSGPECESRWRNCEDPLINRGQWTNVEEKKMLHCFSNRGFSNWIDIAKELKTNRTPYQCLARFQRSLNPSILNNEWTPTEDEELHKAVAEYGENNWQLVASALSGRTGTQSSNRWKKSLNPLRERVGRWNSDEDKRLKIAVRLFGAKNWNKITKFVPGRTQVQCRERWVNCLNPSLKYDKWTEDEDMKLKAAVVEHNYSWSRVAACISPRTDNQCRRRWMVLLPHQVSVLKAAKEIEKRCFVSNFVDREGERPKLTHKDFNKPLLLEGPKANKDNIISKDKKRRTVGKKRPGRGKKVAHTRKGMALVDEDDAENNDGQADITSNGDGENCGVEKEATGKRKSQGKERSTIKVWSRRAKKVAHTRKARKLVDEDDGQADITSNGDGENCEVETEATGKRKSRGKERSTIKVWSRRAKKVAHTGKARKLVDEDDAENNDGQADVTSNGDGENCEVEKEATGSRKSQGKERSTIKVWTRRAKKVAHTGKARKLVDEDDAENNNGQADVTINCDGENCEVEKEATGSRKSQGKERSIKVWTRRARQVTCTTKVSKLINEDVGEDNDGHGDITSNGGLTQQSVKNKATTSLEDAGLLEQDNGEGIITFDGNNCEIKEKPTRNRKQRNTIKVWSRRAKKVAHTGKAAKLVDEGDAENNNGQADVTSNGDGENCEVEKEAAGSRKSQGKERSIKVWTRRSRKATRSTKVLKLIDEDVGEDNDGHGDISSNGRLTQQSVKNKANTSLEDAGLLEQDNGEGIRTFHGDNCEIKKQPTRKRKQSCRGNDEHEEMDENCEPGPISKKKSTKETVLSKLIDEDDGHGDITSNRRVTRQSLKNKANTSLNGEGTRTFNGDNCEIIKTPTQKRKQSVNDEHEEMDANCEPGPISKRSVVCGSAILTNERNKGGSFSVSRSSRVAVMIKDVPSRNESCFSPVMLKSMSGDGPQARTLEKCKVSCKLPNGTNGNHRRGRKRKIDIENNIRKREAVDGSGGLVEIVLEEEETLAN